MRSSSPASAGPLAPLLDLPGVAEWVESARAAVDRLRSHRALRRGGATVTAESALRGARASAALEGADVELATLRAGGTTDPVVQGALRAFLGLGDLVRTWPRAPLQVLARLHVLVAADQLAEHDLGRPTEAANASARLDALASLVSGESQAPAAVLAAVVHGELLAIRPFASANGVVARAAARLTLVTGGLDPRMVSVPEVGHLEQREEYAAALAAYASGTPDGVGFWLRHCCSAIALGAREGTAICEALLRR
jgi:hypothetical protein